MFEASETGDTAVTTAAGRTAAGAGSGAGAESTTGATTALGRAALVDAVAGWVDTDAAGGGLTDLRVGSPDDGLALSLSDVAADGLTFLTTPVDDECPVPDGFFSAVVVDAPALATSTAVL